MIVSVFLSFFLSFFPSFWTFFVVQTTLSLRLALCDFDGQAMLDGYVAHGRQFSTELLASAAPRIQQSATTLANFAASLH